MVFFYLRIEKKYSSEEMFFNLNLIYVLLLYKNWYFYFCIKKKQIV